MTGPLRVRLAEEQQARELARELLGLGGIDVRRDDGSWEVAVADGNSDRLVVMVLDATRRILAGQPTASALVLLDGREYHMRGE